MKSQTAGLIALLVPYIATAQSKFELSNLHSPVVDAPVFDAFGMPLAGSDYAAELWGGAIPDSLTPLVLIDRGDIREIVPFVDRGYFLPTSSSDNLCVTSVGAGDSAWLQVRAWDARLGGTYEEVAALGMGGYGESPLFYADGGNPYLVPPELPGPLIGLESFSLRPVPEPSTWALLALGGLVWAWSARRRQNLRRSAGRRPC